MLHLLVQVSLTLTDVVKFITAHTTNKDKLSVKVPLDLNKVVEQCFNDGTLDDGDGFGQSVERIICKSGDKKYLIDCAGTENEIIEYQKNF